MRAVSLILVFAISVMSQVRGPAAGMSLIRGGTFDMGTEAVDIPKLQERFNVRRAELFAEETPRHRVTLKPFYLDRTEVTNFHFKRFIDQSPEWQKDRIPADYHNGNYLSRWSGNLYPAGEDNYPVSFVSWYAAAAFCQSVGKRLPTEAEWEFAARGGLEGKSFPWGDELPDKTRANFAAAGLNGAIAVAGYPPNGYGLYDIAGNVWEYLADEWGKYPTADRGTEALNLFKDRSYLSVKTRRALRGGSYGGGVVNLRVTYRDSHKPEDAVAHVGFRCAQSVDHDTRSAALASLVAAEREFAAATVREGFRAGFIKYFAEDGIGFGPHPERTKDVLQKRPPSSNPPALVFNWAPMFGDISASGELGYTTGPVLYTDRTAKPVRHGLYFSVWQKQPDGSWKVVIDMGVPSPREVAPLDTVFIAAAPVGLRRANPMKGTPSDDYRQLDRNLSGAIGARSPVAGYRAYLDSEFRFHRKGMMPVTDVGGLETLTSTAIKFEIIGGKTAVSDDLAYTYGKYIAGDAQKRTEAGYYVHVWRRDAESKWRLVADIQNPLPNADDQR
jgi:formylglycine-generating enzyme required for sulfatase activity/ketosteroid isomerase-like protein